MSSTETSPLFTTPSSEQSQLPGDCVRSNSTRSASALTRRSLSRSENMRNPPLSGSLISALRFQTRSQRRRASSRQSEICTPEGIPEVSDEDLSASDSASVFPSAVECSPSGQTPRDIVEVVSGPNSAPKESISIQQDESTLPNSFMDLIDQAFERARLTQEQLPKCLQSTATTRRAKTPGLRVEFAVPLAALAAPDIGLGNFQTLNEVNEGLGSRYRIYDESRHPGSNNGRASINNMIGTSMPLARAVHSEIITPEKTRGLWCPPRPRTPALKKYLLQTHGAASHKKA